MPVTIDLSNLGQNGFIIQGDAADDQLSAVSLAGDVNGDGFDDLIVGATGGDDGGANAGEAYVIFGKAGGFGTIDLTSLAPADGFILQGFFFSAGFSVSSAGDINGDGYDEMIVGAPMHEVNGGPSSGEAFVIYGKASGFGTNVGGRNVIDLATMTAGDGFRLTGDSDDYVGWSVATAGDVNNDGFDDFMVGAIRTQSGGNDAGEAYIIFGKAAAFGTVDLSALAPTDGFSVRGTENFDLAGSSVSTAGDVNGDGYDDIIVGVPRYDVAGLEAGAAFVIFGKASGFANIDIGSLAPADGFAILGQAAFAFAGLSVSSAGDFNGDGFDDVLVGAPLPANNSASGDVYVIFGHAGGFGTLNLQTFSASDGLRITGSSPLGMGDAVSGAGDVNGDGFDDVIVGVKTYDLKAPNAGAAFVILGGAARSGTTQIGSGGPESGFMILGDAANDAAGTSVSRGGDINNDGYADLIVGAPGGDNGGSAAGEAYVIFGSATPGAILGTPGPDNLNGTAYGDDIRGLGGNDRIDGLGGVDWMTGGLGNDTYLVDNSADSVTEAVGEGSDTVSAKVNYTLGAGQEIETLTTYGSATIIAINLTGNEFVNTIVGNNGANTLDGKAGADKMYGHAGNDIFYVDDALDAVIEAGGGGSDWVNANVSYTLAAGLEVELLTTFGSATTNVINLTGNEFANTLVGNAAANILNGKGGADSMWGYAGNDIFYVDNGGDSVTEAVGGGADTVITNVSFALASGQAVEVLRTYGSATTNAADLTGNEFADRLAGNAAANVLDGKGGADVMWGYGGNDTYYVDNSADSVTEAVGGGSDTVRANASFALAAGQEIEQLQTLGSSTTNAIDLTGNEFANTIFGNAAANVLDGKGGADVMYSFAGADAFAFTTALGGGNIDQLIDFQPGTDEMALDDAVFTGLALGPLPAAAFTTGSAAQDADDRIIYNSATGAVLFDVDGVGGQAAVQFATLSPGLAVGVNDFIVI